MVTYLKQNIPSKPPTKAGFEMVFKGLTSQDLPPPPDVPAEE